MTDPVQDEIYGLARAALAKGQERFSVHIFPFRMTAENMAHYAKHEAAETWLDLKPAYDSFERTHVPPQVALCGTRYKVADGLPGETGGTDRRLPILRTASTDEGAVARDASGAWVSPACQFDDEERRIAYYSGGTVGASATTTATIGKVVEARDEPAPPPVRKSEPHHHSKPVHSTKQAAASKPPAVMARPRTPSRPLKRGPVPPRRITAVPSADGFGSSALRGTLRISTHGG
jgi:hypothetical protein